MKKTYAVFGLGKYGTAVARELVANGMDVIAVDSDEHIVNAAAMELPICKCADITDPDVIRQLAISNVDVVIIAMATHLEAGHIDTCKVLAKLKEELKSGIFAIEYACSGDGVIAAKRDMDYIRFLRSWLGI